MRRVLVRGAAGQIGGELVPALRVRCGGANVVASDVRTPQGPSGSDGPFEYVDCQHSRRPRASGRPSVGITARHVVELSAIPWINTTVGPSPAIR